jgi:hypothetical protein
MATKSKKHGCQPAKPLSEQERKKMKQVVLEWHNATCATIANLSQIANDLRDELQNCCSPLHEFFGQPDDLRQLLDSLDEADASLSFVLAREQLTTTTIVPNPCDLLHKDSK